MLYVYYNDNKIYLYAALPAPPSRMKLAVLLLLRTAMHLKLQGWKELRFTGRLIDREVGQLQGGKYNSSLLRGLVLSDKNHTVASRVRSVGSFF